MHQELETFYRTLAVLGRDPRLSERDRRRFAYEASINAREAAASQRKREVEEVNQ